MAEFKPLNRKNTKPPSDLVKLGQRMKLMLNTIIKSNIEAPVVCGMLVEGYKCSTYKMDIPFPGVYRMINLQNFDICHDHSSFSSLPNMYKYLSQLKLIILDTAKKIEMNELSKASGKRTVAQVSPLIRQGTCTFVKAKKQKR